MSRAQRIAWALTVALAAYVVPLRIAELAAHRAAYIAEMSVADASGPLGQPKDSKDPKEETNEAE